MLRLRLMMRLGLLGPMVRLARYAEGAEGPLVEAPARKRERVPAT